jgi:hypothetical protein
MRSILGRNLVRRAGEYGSVPILSGNAFYNAKPDLFVILPSGRIVMDCKYKTLEAQPDHGDVYQLLTHAEAFEANFAVLLYPGEMYATRTLGLTRNGVTLIVASIRPTNFIQDLQELVATLQ